MRADITKLLIEERGFNAGQLASEKLFSLSLGSLPDDCLIPSHDWQPRSMLPQRLRTPAQRSHLHPCAVVVEADYPDAFRLNLWVRGLSQDSTPEAALADFVRFPTWQVGGAGVRQGQRAAQTLSAGGMVQQSSAFATHRLTPPCCQ